MRTEAEIAELLAFIRLCATGPRPDGTYNYEREAIEQRAKELLAEQEHPAT